MIDIDFETRSGCDIQGAGAWRYSNDPTTIVLCMAYNDGEGETKIWIPKNGIKAPAWCYSLDLIKAKGGIRAHNAGFEQAIWKNILVKFFGFVDVPIEYWHDTMAQCAASVIPFSLGESSAVLNLPVQKDEEGRRVMLQLSQQRRPSKDNPKIWWEPEDVPDKFAQLYKYCINDVDTQIGIGNKLPPLSSEERLVWELDQKINQRGIKIDRSLAEKCLLLIDQYVKHKSAIVFNLTNGISVYQVAKLRDWVISRGIDTQDVSKSSVAKILASDNIPDDVRTVLEIRQSLGKSSTKKIAAMCTASDTDERIRYTALYHGAGTGRWAGRLIQPQNFARGTIDKAKHGFDMDEAIEMLTNLNLQELEDKFEKAGIDFMDVISSCLRGFICAKKGNKLVQADYANIEGRILAWLAGESWKVDAFKDFDKGIGADLYKLAYSRAFNIPIDQVDKAMRQIGKVMELALGYQGGVGAFRTMAKSFGIRLAPQYELVWASATESEKSSALKLLALAEKKNKSLFGKTFDDEEFKDYFDFRHEFLACDIVKQKWRAAHPNVVQLWSKCEEAAISAVNNKNNPEYVTDDLYYIYDGSYLYCVLPSGRKLSYPSPKIRLEKSIGWNGQERTKAVLTYMAVNSVTRKWETHTSYGGHLVENIVQAIARDCLVAGMFAAEDSGYEIVMTVHDEIVAEVNESFGSVNDFENIITKMPYWARGLPLAAEGWEAKRYRK